MCGVSEVNGYGATLGLDVDIQRSSVDLPALGNPTYKIKMQYGYRYLASRKINVKLDNCSKYLQQICREDQAILN